MSLIARDLLNTVTEPYLVVTDMMLSVESQKAVNFVTYSSKMVFHLVADDVLFALCTVVAAPYCYSVSLFLFCPIPFVYLCFIDIVNKQTRKFIIEYMRIFVLHRFSQDRCRDFINFNSAAWENSIYSILCLLPLSDCFTSHKHANAKQSF